MLSVWACAGCHPSIQALCRCRMVVCKLVVEMEASPFGSFGIRCGLLLRIPHVSIQYLWLAGQPGIPTSWYVCIHVGHIRLPDIRLVRRGEIRCVAWTQAMSHTRVLIFADGSNRSSLQAPALCECQKHTDIKLYVKITVHETDKAVRWKVEWVTHANGSSRLNTIKKSWETFENRNCGGNDARSVRLSISFRYKVYDISVIRRILEMKLLQILVEQIILPAAVASTANQVSCQAWGVSGLSIRSTTAPWPHADTSIKVHAALFTLAKKQWSVPVTDEHNAQHARNCAQSFPPHSPDKEFWWMLADRLLCSW